MTPSEFKDLFPEFAGATDTLVQSRLTWAEARTPAEVWGSKQDQGIAWLAAHFLCLLPEAKDMRQGEAPGETSYGRERRRLARAVASGFRVAGLPETT